MFVYGFASLYVNGLVSWGRRISRPNISRWVDFPNERLGYDTKQSDGEVRECGVPLYSYGSHVHSDPEW